MVYDLFEHEFLKDTGVKLLEDGLLKCISYQEEIKIKKPKKDLKNKEENNSENEEYEEIEIEHEIPLDEDLINSYYKNDQNFKELNKRKRKYEINFKIMEKLQRPEVLLLRKIATKCFFYLFAPFLSIFSSSFSSYSLSISSSPSLSTTFSSHPYYNLASKFSTIDYRLLAYLIRLGETSYEEIDNAKREKIKDLKYLEENPPVPPAPTVPAKGKEKEKDKELEAQQLLIDQEKKNIEEKYINNSINSLQNLIYVLKLLTFFVQFSKSHYKKIIFKQKKFLFLLCNLLQFHEKLILPLSQFFSVIIPTLDDWRFLLSSNIQNNEEILENCDQSENEGIEQIQNEEIKEEKIKFLSSILICISQCTSQLEKLLPPPPPPELNPKDKKAAAAAKKNSKDPPAAPPVPPPDYYKDLEGTRMPQEVWFSTTLHCLHIVLSSLSLDPSITFNLYHIDQFATFFSTYSFNKVFQSVNYLENIYPDLDQNINDFFEFAVSLIGKLSEKDEKIRKYLIKKDFIKKLQLLLKDSRNILTPKIKKLNEDESIPPEEIEKELNDEEKYYFEMKLNSLRKILDKSILSLIAQNNVSSSLDPSSYLSPPLPSLENPSPCCSLGLSTYIYHEDDLDLIFSQWVSLIGDEYELPLRHFSVRQFSSLVFSTSNGNNEKLLEKISSTDSQFFSSICSYIDININSCLENPLEIEEAYSEDDNESFKKSTNFSTITSLQGLYYSFHLTNNYLNKLDHFIQFIKQDRLDLLKQLLVLTGSSISNPTLNEIMVSLYHPRALSWPTLNEYDSNNNPYNISTKFIEKKYLRPVIINLLSTCIEHFDIFLTNTELVELEPLTQLPEINSKLRNEVYIIISTLSDVIFSILQNIVDYNTFVNSKTNKNLLTINFLSNNLIPEELLLSLIQYIEASGKSHCSGMCGILQSISAAGFSDNIQLSSFSSLYSVIAQNFQNEGSTTDNENSPPNFILTPNSYTWTRPLYYEEIGFIGDMIPSDISNLISTPLLWPFIIVLSPLIAILSNPLSSPLSINYALNALESITKMKFFSNENQPLFVDIFITLFLSLGGSFSLLELNGIFGNQFVTKDLAGNILNRFFTHGLKRETYWKDIYEQQKAALAQIDPKAKGKKDDKPKEKKLSKAEQKALASVIPPLFDNFVLNIENSEEFNDPNHGPNGNHWKSLLDLSYDNIISKSKNSNLLINSILNDQLEVSKLLINQNIDVNFQDFYGRSALMYALLFNLEELTKLLLDRDALVNLIDNSSIPTLFYSLCTNSFDSIKDNVFLPKNTFSSLYGTFPLLDLLLHHNPLSNNENTLGGGPIDLHVTDSNGYSSLFFSLGIGKIDVIIYEKTFTFLNSAYYVKEYDVAPLFVKLYNAGANLDLCSKEGVVPLHLVSCVGDYDLVEFILSHGGTANPLDSELLHPIHYVLSSCPKNVEQIFNLLLTKGNNREFKQMIFNNDRDNKTFIEKESLEIDNFFSLFEDVSLPKILTESRNIISDLLLMKSSKNKNEVSPIFCAFAGNYFLKGHNNFDQLHEHVLLQDEQTNSSSDFYKTRRSNLVKLILDKASEASCLISLINHQSYNNLNIIHAASLLFQGLTPRKELTPEQIRCKRIKYYESIELNILDIIYNNIQDYNYFSNVTSYYSELLPSTFYIKNNNDVEFVESDKKIEEKEDTQEVEIQDEQIQQSGWSPLHATIYFGNFDFFQFLISLPTITMDTLLIIHPIHLIASSKHDISDEFINFIISQCLLRQDATSLLINSSISYKFEHNNNQFTYLATPLHIAIYNKKFSLLEKLSILPQIDFNKHALYISSEESEDQIYPLSTPIHLAAQYNDPLLIESLFNGKDKMDFTIKSYSFFTSINQDSQKETCIDYVLNNKYYQILENFVNMRKNDILLHILSTENSPDGNSILYHLEKENFDLLAALKYPLILDSPVIINEEKTKEEIVEEQVTSLTENQTDNEGNQTDNEKEIPTLTSSPSALFYYEDEEFEEVPVVIVDPYYKLDSSHPFLSLSQDELKNKLFGSNKVLTILLELVQANNFTDSSLHFQSMYSTNQLILDM